MEENDFTAVGGEARSDKVLAEPSITLGEWALVGVRPNHRMSHAK